MRRRGGPGGPERGPEGRAEEAVPVPGHQTASVRTGSPGPDGLRAGDGGRGIQIDRNRQSQAEQGEQKNGRKTGFWGFWAIFLRLKSYGIPGFRPVFRTFIFWHFFWAFFATFEGSMKGFSTNTGENRHFSGRSYSVRNFFLWVMGHWPPFYSIFLQKGFNENVIIESKIF